MMPVPEQLQVAQPQAMPMPMPTPEQIEEAKLIADSCTWEEVKGVLHSDDRRNFTVNVETDATAFEDVEREKAQRIEFLTAMTGWLEKALPAMQGNPTIRPLMKEMTQFAVGAFKIGRPLEEAFEDAFDQIDNMPPPPNPEAEKAKAELEMKKEEWNARMTEKMAEVQLRKEELQQGMEAKAREFEFEREKIAAELDMKRQEFAANRDAKRQELGLKSTELRLNHDASLLDQALRYEDAEAKRTDIEERRAADVEDKAMRRDLEAKVLTDRSQQHADAINVQALERAENTLVSQIASIAEQINAVLMQVGGQQEQIATAITSIAENQSQTTEAVKAIARHATAERRIRRDPKTNRVVGVDIIPAKDEQMERGSVAV